MIYLLWFLVGCCLVLTGLALLTAGTAMHKANQLEKRIDTLIAAKGGAGGAPAFAAVPEKRTDNKPTGPGVRRASLN